MEETVELRELRVFLTLCEELHFGRTAQRLGVTPSRVSQTIARLETVLGQTLFERTSRRVALSAGGQELRDAVEPSYRELLGALARSAARGGALTGELRVGMLSFIAADAVEQVTAAFEASHPACRVRLVEVTLADAVDSLRRGEIDALVARSLGDPQGIVDGPGLLSEPRVLVVADDHRLAGRESVSYEVVADYAIADLPGMPAELRDAVNPAVTPGGRPIQRTVSVSSLHEALAAVAQGHIVHVTAASLARYVTYPGVSFIPIHDAEPLVTKLLRRADDPDPRVAAFFAAAEAQASDQ